MGRILAVLTIPILLANCSRADPPDPGFETKASARVGPSDLPGDASTESISATFSPDDLRALHARLNSAAFIQNLQQYACGGPPRSFQFSVAMYEQAEYQERLVCITSNQRLDPGHDRCLSFGLSYEINLVMNEIDKGPPIDYGYHDPLTGKKLAPPGKERLSKPLCDCAKRNSNQEWVM